MDAESDECPAPPRPDPVPDVPGREGVHVRGDDVPRVCAEAGEGAEAWEFRWATVTGQQHSMPAVEELEYLGYERVGEDWRYGTVLMRRRCAVQP